MIDHPLILFVLFPLIAYAIGATPFGPIIARFHGVDLRKHGSGNVGATNCGRVLGRKWGYLCFGLDVAKGLIPTLVAGMLLKDSGPISVVQQAAWLAVGLACILGHVFSFWLKFRGGKGVATSLGVVLGIFPYFTFAGLAAFAVWCAVTLTSRYVSLGSIVAAVSFVPLFVLINWFSQGLTLLQLWPLASFATAISLLIIYLHKSNIRRLLAGQENKIGSR